MAPTGPIAITRPRRDRVTHPVLTARRPRRRAFARPAARRPGGPYAGPSRARRPTMSGRSALPAAEHHEHHRPWRYEMLAVVVYESFWGNTAAIARAIAEGMGPEATAMTTDEATAEVVSGAYMIVAGAPVVG